MFTPIVLFVLWCVTFFFFFFFFVYVCFSFHIEAYGVRILISIFHFLSHRFYGLSYALKEFAFL